MSTETIGGGAFGQRLLAGCRGKRVPLVGSIEITRRCPLSCVHCFNRLPMRDASARARELTVGQHKRLLDEIAAAGCLWVLFTGGEIFARPDFLEIYTHAKKLGLLVTLFTNAALVTDRIADCLKEWRPLSIEISLYGARRGTFEAATRTPGSYDRCFAGLERLMARDLPLRLKTVATKLTRDEILAMRRMAQGFGLPFRFDALINPCLDRWNGPLAMRLTPEEVVELDLHCEERVRLLRASLDSARAHPDQRGEMPRARLFQCGGGASSFAIDPYGRLSLCLMIEHEKYDLLAGSFEEGWERFLGEMRERERKRFTRCDGCQLRPVCGQCPAAAFLEHGDPEQPVDFFCRVAHLRAARMDFLAGDSHCAAVDVPATNLQRLRL